MRKLNIFALLLVVCILSLSSCGKAKEKITEKASEKLAESVIEMASDEITDIQNNGEDELVIDTEAGEIAAGDDIEWPNDLMGDLPVPEAKVTFVMPNDKGGATVNLDEMSREDADAYGEKIRELGYTGGMNLIEEDTLMVGGKNEEGATVNFMYNATAEEAVLNYSSTGE